MEQAVINVNPHIIPASRFVGVGSKYRLRDITAARQCLACGGDIYFRHPFYTGPYHPACELEMMQR